MIDGKYPPIERLLPHRPPMILVDRLVRTNGVETVCEVTIGPHSMFLQTAGVPAFVGIEYMAQAVAAHGGYQSYLEGQPIVVGLLLGTRRFETHCQFFELGQALRIEVTHTWGHHELMRFRCTISHAVSNTRLQRAELNVFKPKALQSYLEAIGHDNTCTYHWWQPGDRTGYRLGAGRPRS
jgi:predicted hotdog family 3-hydroxylacyl-ACP dehydratase